MAPLGTHSGQLAQMAPNRGVKAALVRRRVPNPKGSDFVRRRLTISPPGGPLLAKWPEWAPRGALKPLSFEDDSQFQFDAFSFEDDPPFRPPGHQKKLKMAWEVLPLGGAGKIPTAPSPCPNILNRSKSNPRTPILPNHSPHAGPRGAADSYSQAGGRNQQKTMISKHPQRKSVLHESRDPYPCHTFRDDAAVFFRAIVQRRSHPCATL